MYNYLNVCFYFAILCIANYNHLYLVCEGNKSILNLNLNLYSLIIAYDMKIQNGTIIHWQDNI